MNKIEITDRYIALGIPYPDPETVCEGQCEGTGYVPVKKKGAGNSLLEVDGETDSRLLQLWEKAEKENPSDDGYHFVKCPDCDGSGKQIR